MRTTCPNCNHALTIREAIQHSCSKCASQKSRQLLKEVISSSSIKTISMS